MKKKIIILLLTLLVMPVLALPAKAVTTVTDQACTYNGDETAYTPIRNIHSYGQTFTVASITKLTSVKLYLSAFPGDYDGSIQVTITRLSDGHNFGGPSLNFGTNHMIYPWEEWYSFNFGALAPDVTPGQKYRINIINTSPDFQQAFAIDNNLGYLNCNTSGAATEGGVEKDYDFLFQVIGNLPEATGIPGTPGNSGTTSTGSSGTGTRPAATTLASIKSPTNLLGVYEADKKDIKLTWGKSVTTDIIGYRVFRSEQKTTGFTKVGEVKKDVLEYVDTNNIVSEKTYFYFVRAYKTIGESASSNTVEIAIPKVTPSAATPTIKTKVSPTITPKTENKSHLCIWWLIGIWLLLILILIAIYLYIKKKRHHKTLSSTHDKRL